MAAEAATSQLTRARARSAPAWVAAVAVGLAALLPRALGLDDFYTIDEGYHWPGRVERFAEALRLADWAATNQTGHPGVTTMWLGALGRWLAALRGIPDPGWAGGGAAYLGMLRLPLAVANALAVVAGFLLLRRLVRPPVALLGALLWATSPFLIAHGRLLHLDALLTSFMTLSVLLLLVSVLRGEKEDVGEPGSPTPPPSRGERGDVGEPGSPTPPPREAGRAQGAASLRGVAASGVVAGLALLTKAPSLILLPFVGLALFWTMGDGRWATAGSSKRSIAHRLSSIVYHRLRGAIPPYIVWLAAAALTVFALWPAMWVAPLDAAGAVVREIVENGGQPHHSGNYFLGEPVGDPGPLFYPAVLLWRTTPVTLIGLLAFLLFGLRRAPGRGAQTERRALVALLCFALLFGALMGMQAKKLDRYLLPIWPALEILAAGGLVQLAGKLERLWRQRGESRGSGASEGRATHRRWASALGLSGVGALLLANLAWYHPYYLSFYNPLLGGGAAAERVMLVGMGEGMDQVGAWLSARPDLARGDVLSWIPPTLAPFVPREVLVRDLREEFVRRPSSYAVLYVRSVQHKESAAAEAYVRQSPALFTLRMHGVEYASVHQLPRPFDTPSGAVFGDGLHLRGFSHALLGSTLVITPSWDVRADRPGGAFSFVHVLDAGGRRVGQIDAPIDRGMFATWQAGQQFDGALPIELPADLAPGDYRVVLGVYEPESGGRLALTSGVALPPEVDGPNAIELTTLRLP